MCVCEKPCLRLALLIAFAFGASAATLGGTIAATVPAPHGPAAPAPFQATGL